jgi:hypothetical protein
MARTTVDLFELNWVAVHGGDVFSIFGNKLPNVQAIQSYYDVSHGLGKMIRWINKTDDTIHEFEVAECYTREQEFEQLQALLVAIRLS